MVIDNAKRFVTVNDNMVELTGKEFDLLLGFVLALLIILCLVLKLHRVQDQLFFIKDALENLKSGNLNRRVLARENDMTSLSHDVKTPLVSLVGYLEAIENGLVAGQEKDEYVHAASDKTHHLKNFVTALFEWVNIYHNKQEGQAVSRCSAPLAVWRS